MQFCHELLGKHSYVHQLSVLVALIVFCYTHTCHVSTISYFDRYSMFHLCLHVLMLWVFILLHCICFVFVLIDVNIYICAAYIDLNDFYFV